MTPIKTSKMPPYDLRQFPLQEPSNRKSNLMASTHMTYYMKSPKDALNPQP
ncbi:hypothetical protein AMATHDRAFT_10996 [Amanita thiersii Skay4041]|uniref:Uncharacterized protein n=1 Tax=Amanita thiersii Skay4041 TaxID=703135 RepID=A0A2A9N5U1_9AGAR|nr:hypothetical protein AMATHDRAFT_10996 [Amanita thiersii Skay4041]